MAKVEKERFVRISALLWADILVAYALFVMQNYLTDVWGLSLIRAALVLNIWNGAYRVLPVFFLYLVHAFLGNFRLLVLTSLSYTAGITMVAVSTPPLFHATGACKRYQPECVGGAQRGLLIAGLALIAVGVAGNLVSVKPFLFQQRGGGSSHSSGTGSGSGSNGAPPQPKAEPHQVLGLIGVVVVGIAGAIALPYIRPRTLKFGIPAICTAVGTFLFLTGSRGYKKGRQVTESPLCIVCRVFVASALKCFRSYPEDDKLVHRAANEKFTHTRCLRGLHKAAISDDHTQTTNKWRLCTVAEVEETKIAVRMVPMWMTFIVCGVVAAVGDTYFVEQAGKLDRNIGKLRLPIQVLLLARRSAKDYLSIVVKWMLKSIRRDVSPMFGIGLGMICSILCCITAAMVEKKRLHVVISHGLLDKPDEKIDMSVYWLLFQFVLLGGLESFLDNSVSVYYQDQSPKSMENYLVNFIRGVTGLGYMCSALSVYVVGRISERGGKPNWFQHTLNRSRLDRYYWVLAGMSTVNLVVFVFVALLYRYNKPAGGGADGLDAGPGYTDHYTEGDQNRSCTCFC